MTQAHRGLADTALGIGDDISASISQLYAPPGAWSHGYLWGADIVTIPRGRRLQAEHGRDLEAERSCGGGVEPAADRARPTATCSRSTRRPPSGR